MERTKEYEELFRSEAREYLSQLNTLVLRIEKNPEDRDAINEAFRAFHTIKGMAASLGYTTIVEISHELEDELDAVRQGKKKVTEELIEKLFSGIDKLEGLIEKKEERKIRIYLSKDTPLPAARAVVILNIIKSKGELLGTDPPEEEIVKGNFQNSFVVHFRGAGIAEEIASMEDVEGIEEVLEEKEEVEEEKEETYIKKAKDVRVPIERLDRLQNLVGELVIGKEQILRMVSRYNLPDLAELMGGFSRIIQELQDEVMKIRMVPLSTVFSRFPRYVRDLSKKLGKEVDFIMRGTEIELDRSLLDALSDPLIHLLRNAVDHGIEPPEERIKKGKPRKGRIELNAVRMKDSIMIEVSDDGKGIDVDKVLERAKKMGLVEEEAELTEGEILKFLFTPGFSTSEEITDISGRGVGMDVVKEAMRMIGGSVDIKTEKGKGTRCSLKVPLTMAIIRAFLIKLEDDTFAIPMTYIDETVEVERGKIQHVHKKEVLVLRNEVIPVIWLGKRLGYKIKENQHKLPVIISSAEGLKYGVIVDEFIGATDIVVKPLPPLLGDLDIFAGVTILGDGRPGLIIDVPNLI